MSMDEIRNGESATIEFKETLPEKSIKYMKSVVAFANGCGGRIIFGIEDGTGKGLIPALQLLAAKFGIQHKV